MQKSSQVSLGVGVGSALSSQGSQGGSQGGSTAALQPHAVQDSISRLFDDLLAESDTVARMAPPAERVVTPLLRHQQEALAWMVHRENSNALPPFWDVHKVRGCPCAAPCSAAVQVLWQGCHGHHEG